MNFPDVKQGGENHVQIIRDSRTDGRTRLILNGTDISSNCLGFELKQDGADGPEMNITLSVKTLEIALDGVKAGVKAKNPSPLVTEAAV